MSIDAYIVVALVVFIVLSLLGAVRKRGGDMDEYMQDVDSWVVGLWLLMMGALWPIALLMVVANAVGKAVKRGGRK